MGFLSSFFKFRYGSGLFILYSVVHPVGLTRFYSLFSRLIQVVLLLEN